jgi:hypothetical protein
MIIHEVTDEHFLLFFPEQKYQMTLSLLSHSSWVKPKQKVLFLEKLAKLFISGKWEKF